MYMCRKACKLFWCCRPDHIGNFWKILLWTVCIIIALAVGKIVLAMKMFSKFSGMMYDPFNNTTAMPVTIQDIQVQFCTTTTDAINMWKFGSRNSDKSGGWYWSLTVFTSNGPKPFILFNSSSFQVLQKKKHHSLT